MGNINIVLTGHTIYQSQQFFYLAWEHVYTMNLEHVIASSLDDIQSWISSAAIALSRNNAGNIMGTETDQRCSLFYQCSNDDLTFFAVRHRLSCLWINDLNIKIIIPVMHARLLTTKRS